MWNFVLYQIDISYVQDKLNSMWNLILDQLDMD